MKFSLFSELLWPDFKSCCLCSACGVSVQEPTCSTKFLIQWSSFFPSDLSNYIIFQDVGSYFIILVAQTSLEGIAETWTIQWNKLMLWQLFCSSPRWVYCKSLFDIDYLELASDSTSLIAQSSTRLCLSQIPATLQGPQGCTSDQMNINWRVSTTLSGLINSLEWFTELRKVLYLIVRFIIKVQLRNSWMGRMHRARMGGGEWSFHTSSRPAILPGPPCVHNLGLSPQ